MEEEEEERDKDGGGRKKDLIQEILEIRERQETILMLLSLLKTCASFAFTLTDLTDLRIAYTIFTFNSLFLTLTVFLHGFFSISFFSLKDEVEVEKEDY